MLTEITKTSIPLTADEVSLVSIFLENLATFKPMIQARIMDMKNGSVTINFDAQGKLQTIEKRFVAYRLTKGES